LRDLALKLMNYLAARQLILARILTAKTEKE
jgi:hypothetical protein